MATATRTALVDRIGGWALTHRIAGKLSGDYDDLRRLVAAMNARPPRDSYGLMSFLRTLERDIATRSGLAALFARLGRQLSPRAKRKLLRNLIYNWAAIGARRRNERAAAGQWVPSFVVMSPTMRCNLKCTGCYSGLYSKRGELGEADIRRILDECRSIGAYFVVVSGGEPYLLRDMWLRIFRDYSDMYFLTYTNGTLLDQQTVDAIARLGNVAPAISVEGHREATDARRGAGVHDKVQAAADRLCGARVAALRRRFPIFLADFWNDGPAAAGCLAARTYLHILNSGQIEPCVFAHFGLDNIRDKTLVEAVNSPFFRAIRREFPYNENGNLRRPCMIVDNPQVLRKVVAQHLVPAGHEHSEDVIKDPKVVAWADDYSAWFKALTDPLWEAQISDPADRWHREGREYKNLFRFRQKPPEAQA